MTPLEAEVALSECFLSPPTRFSGDGKNPHPGPGVRPFAVWVTPTFSVTVTFTSPSESVDGVKVVSVCQYRS